MGFTNFLIIFILILLYTLQSLFSRLYTDSYPGDKHIAAPVFSITAGVIVSVVSLVFLFLTPGSHSFDWQTLLLGIANAAVIYGYNKYIIKASASGSYSIMMVFNLGGGIVIPALVKSIIPYTNGSVSVITWVQAVAIIAICIAVYMVSFKKETNTEKENNKSARWFLVYCALLGLCNGAYGVLFDVQNEISGASGKQLMVIYTFIGGAIIALIRLLADKRICLKKAFTQTRKSLVYLILTSIVSALAINILVLLIGAVDLTLLYTFDNAGVMLLSALFSWALFKERLTPLNITGCALMAFGLILMGAYEEIGAFFAAL